MKRAQPNVKTVRQVLEALRAWRAADPNAEIAWQDFLELSEMEQREVIFLGLMVETAYRRTRI